tara:strand:+ start:16163 stop:16705 length:543 start_codon:yes stop_codon:yes gene_type:complete
MKNKVFVATSIDGYIADKNGDIDFLHSIPNPEGDDMGYSEFMEDVDALIMGRTTFETVCNFDVPWPYDKPVFVLSNSLEKIAPEYKEKATLVNGSLNSILDQIHKKGYHNLYIDGGKTIQSFLKEELIDEITITIIPVLLGGGTSLFGKLDKKQRFRCVETKRYLDQVVQNHFKKVIKSE